MNPAQEKEHGATLRRPGAHQDAVWMLFIILTAVFGPDRKPVTIFCLSGLALVQIAEPRVSWLASRWGSVAALALKLGLCYVLIGYTGAIVSSYYWILLIPVISAAMLFGPIGTLVATALACAVYLSFVLFLTPDVYIDAEQKKELALRLLNFPLVAYLTNRLAEANRVAARRHQVTAEQLSEANRHLQEAEAAVRRSERLAALGQLSAGLAHELRNPLGTIKTSAELLERNVVSENEVAREMAEFISSEVDRTNTLVSRFLDFARPLALQPERGDITETIDRAARDVEQRKPPLEVSVYRNYSPDIRPFFFDPMLMERVFYNLLLNAAEASPPRSTVTVKTRQSGDVVEIDVIDTGAGIDPKALESIFNPFFTTKSHGVGLGLAVVSRIVDEHGGKITVETEPGAGAVFRVFLPARDSAEDRRTV
ncbi:MAG TPA: ATP-binding protein [Bryobacteraceae bacterium]|nr:ATP-binding protein [Bryobacteraceae bacterium]